MKKLLISLIFLCLVGSAEETNTPPEKEMNRMQTTRAKQQKQIQKGVETGKITPTEQNSLEKTDKVIVGNEANVVGDSEVTPPEKDQIKLQQNIRGKQIKRLKTNKNSSN